MSLARSRNNKSSSDQPSGLSRGRPVSIKVNTVVIESMACWFKFMLVFAIISYSRGLTHRGGIDFPRDLVLSLQGWLYPKSSRLAGGVGITVPRLC